MISSAGGDSDEELYLAGLQLNVKDVTGMIDSTNNSLRESVQEEMKNRLINSYSKSHPVSKSQQEQEQKSFMEKAKETYDDMSTGEVLAAIANPLIGASIHGYNRGGHETNASRAKSVLEAGLSLVGLESE